MHGECIYPAIMNFNAYRQCLSFPLPAQQLSGHSNDKYFGFLNLSMVAEQIFFEIRSLFGEQSLLIPYRGKWHLSVGLKPNFKNIPIAYEAIQLAIVNATLLYDCNLFPAQGACRYDHGERNNRFILATPPMLQASLPSLTGRRSYRRVTIYAAP